MTLVDLDEYETDEIELDADAAAALAAAAGPGLTFNPTFQPGWFRITTNSHVGTVATGDVEVRIRPKVPIDNVLYLLTSGWRRPWLRPESVAYEQSELGPAVAALFADAVTQLLRRGPQQTYVEMDDDLDTIRGRIDLTAQFRRPGQFIPVTCEFSELTSDTPANRYLKHAVRLAIRIPGVWQRTRSQLRHALAGLERVGEQPPPADLPVRMHFTRLTRAYEPVLRLAHLIRARVGLGDVRGDAQASSFLLDMNELFERFIEDSLRQQLHGDLVVDGQITDHLDVQRHVPIRPDLVFRDATGEPVYVGDAKYKISPAGLGRATDYYQLHAYCTRYRLPEGLLIYATVDEDTPAPRSVTTAGDGIRLRTMRIPLSGPSASIQRSIAALSDDILTQSMPPATVPSHRPLKPV